MLFLPGETHEYLAGDGGPIPGALRSSARWPTHSDQDQIGGVVECPAWLNARLETRVAAEGYRRALVGVQVLRRDNALCSLARLCDQWIKLLNSCVYV